MLVVYLSVLSQTLSTSSSCTTWVIGILLQFAYDMRFLIITVRSPTDVLVCDINKCDYLILRVKLFTRFVCSGENRSHTHIFGYSLDNSQWQSSPKNGEYSHINRNVSSARITFPVCQTIYHDMIGTFKRYYRNTPCGPSYIHFVSTFSFRCLRYYSK